MHLPQQGAELPGGALQGEDEPAGVVHKRAVCQLPAGVSVFLYQQPDEDNTVIRG